MKVTLSTSKNTTSSATLFYDGHCAICRKVKALIEFVDIHKKIRLVDLWTTSSSEEFKHLDFQKLIKKIHCIDNKGEIYTGYYAFRQVAKIVLLLFPFYLLSFLPGINHLGTIVYKFISENRYRFGCETCGKLYCKVHSLTH